ncbi:MAG: DUF4248 domain-containing protein [Bacteroidaceae bacterium]|nr:DUF4248 domain-containing protein [Bacteroidaceae bacterium]
MGKFQIKDYNFGELAQLYYPDRMKHNAVQLFRRELVQTSALCKALQALDYKGNERVLTRSQVRVIVQHLDDP